MDDDIFYGYGVPVDLVNNDDFLKIRETLTRIGIPSFNKEKLGNKGRALIQSCHILHKRGRYAIVHFKELFMLDGKDTYRVKNEDGYIVKETHISEDDIARRNTIASLLESWGLLHIIEPEKFITLKIPISKLKILSHSEKNQWEMISKHSLGKRKYKYDKS